MNKVKLYKHNQKTFDNVIKLWNDGVNKVGIVQATGTGKSYIIAEVCKEFKNKNILILAPKIHMLDSLKDIIESSFNITFMTYSKLHLMEPENIESLNPDLIILDEFHRCGSTGWGKTVTYLLDSYPNCKVLGTTATNVRYLDGCRDMAIEIFDNNLACKSNVIDAINEGILPMPLYVTSLYSLDEEVSKIERSLNPKDKNYEIITDKLDKLKDWNSTIGVPSILRKHIDGSINKFIVFCKNQKHLDEVFSTVYNWFKEANIMDDVKTYKVTFENSQKNNAKAIDSFKKGDSNSIHLLFSIDILNEGLHIDSTGVILLRETASPIIFFQQIGRALSVSSSQKPIIFDFVNNFNSLKVAEFKNMLIESRKRMATEKESKDIKGIDFTLYDETKSIKELLDETIELMSDNWDLRYDELCDFFKLNNHCLVPSNDKEYSLLYKWTYKQMYLYNKNLLSQEKIDKLNAISFPWDIKLGRWMLNFNRLSDFYKLHNSTKVPASYDKQLYDWCVAQRTNRSKLSELQINLLLSLNFKFNVLDEEFEEKIQELINYKEVYGDLLIPRRYAENPKLANWVHRIRNPKEKSLLSEDKIDRLNELGFVWNIDEYNWNLRFEELSKYYSETKDYMNQGSIRSNKKLKEWVNRQRQYYRLGKLSDEKISKLTSINFIFDIQILLKKNA